MARKVFFSFEYKHDVSRAMVVRHSWVLKDRGTAGFSDAAAFEAVKKQGDAAIKAWIDQQLHGTSVTAVLIGSHTCSSRYVRYEIDESIKRGNGLLQIDVSHILDLNRKRSWCCGRMIRDEPLYNWISDDGYNNLGRWVEQAATRGAVRWLFTRMDRPK